MESPQDGSMRVLPGMRRPVWFRWEPGGSGTGRQSAHTLEAILYVLLAPVGGVM